MTILGTKHGTFQDGSGHGFRTWNLGRLYLTTFRHTGSYPLNERAWSVVEGRHYGEGRAFCFRPWLHRTNRHRTHRVLVVGVRSTAYTASGETR